MTQNKKKYSVTIFNINHMTQNKKQHILVKFSISTYVGNQSSMSNEKIIQELYSEWLLLSAKSAIYFLKIYHALRTCYSLMFLIVYTGHFNCT